MNTIQMSIVPIIFFTGLFLWLCVYEVMKRLKQIAAHRQEIELKQLLADRGMSAAEIVQVVQATRASDEGKPEFENGSIKKFKTPA